MKDISNLESDLIADIYRILRFGLPDIFNHDPVMAHIECVAATIRHYVDKISRSHEGPFEEIIFSRFTIYVWSAYLHPSITEGCPLRDSTVNETKPQQFLKLFRIRPIKGDSCILSSIGCLLYQQFIDIVSQKHYEVSRNIPLAEHVLDLAGRF